MTTHIADLPMHPNSARARKTLRLTRDVELPAVVVEDVNAANQRAQHAFNYRPPLLSQARSRATDAILDGQHPQHQDLLALLTGPTIEELADDARNQMANELDSIVNHHRETILEAVREQSFTPATEALATIAERTTPGATAGQLFESGQTEAAKLLRSADTHWTAIGNAYQCRNTLFDLAYDDEPIIWWNYHSRLNHPRRGLEGIETLGWVSKVPKRPHTGGMRQKAMDAMREGARLWLPTPNDIEALLSDLDDRYRNGGPDIPDKEEPPAKVDHWTEHAIWR